MFFSLIGCDNEDEFSETMNGEGEYWEVEFNFPEEGENFYYVLSYKGDIDDLTPDENIRIGYLWLHKDAELVVDENQDESLADIILNQPGHTLNEMIDFQGDRSEGISLYELNIYSSSHIEINDEEVEIINSDSLARSEREEKASDLIFAVNWGDNSESFIVD